MRSWAEAALLFLFILLMIALMAGCVHVVEEDSWEEDLYINDCTVYYPSNVTICRKD